MSFIRSLSANDVFFISFMSAMLAVIIAAISYNNDVNYRLIETAKKRGYVQQIDLESSQKFWVRVVKMGEDGGEDNNQESEINGSQSY